jgi:alkylglycerol monooxygenase
VKALDAAVMSPSNHRVHHARNPRYIDRNFGGSLVLWDKLFGTYVAEDETPEYGVLHLPEATTTVVRSLGGFPELFVDLRRAGGPRAAVQVALGRPR